MAGFHTNLKVGPNTGGSIPLSLSAAQITTAAIPGWTFISALTLLAPIRKISTAGIAVVRIDSKYGQRVAAPSSSATPRFQVLASTEKTSAAAHRKDKGERMIDPNGK